MSIGITLKFRAFLIFVAPSFGRFLGLAGGQPRQFPGIARPALGAAGQGRAGRPSQPAMRSAGTGHRPIDILPRVNSWDSRVKQHVLA